MSVVPTNSEEDYYIDEPFDDDSQSEAEEEQEYEEEQVPEESDSQSDSDVEAQFLRGNPHARRQQICADRSGGRQSNVNYASSSSEDEAPVVITKVVVEVNKSSQQQSNHTDDETMSVRTLLPDGPKDDDGNLTEQEDLDENELTEVEDEMEDDMGDREQEVVFDNEYEANDLGYDQGNEETEDEEDVEIGQLTDEEPDNQNKKRIELNQDLVDVADDSESELDSSRNMDNAMDSFAMLDREPITKPQNKRGYQYHSNLARQPIVDANGPPMPKLENIYDHNEDEVFNVDIDCLPNGDPLNVNFLEQQMTQMSEMIMKTFRMSGGSADSIALEQLAMATNLMKKKSSKLPETNDEEDPDSISTLEVRLEKDRGACRCPSSSNLNEPDDDSYLMNECGQGDGHLRYPNLKQANSARINCRMPSVTPSSFNSDNTGYHINVRRPRSAASSEFNYKNLGRKSFSFTNPQVREIERQNNILLKKMMNVKPTIKSTLNPVRSTSNVQATPPAAPRMTSAAINRKKHQRQIDLDNYVLKRKLESVGKRQPLFK